MKRTLLALAIIVTLLLSSGAWAQSEEEVDAKMKEIREMMKDLEQMFARAAANPEEMASIIRQLQQAVDTEDPAKLPEAIRKYLENDPENLAKLVDPEADEAKLKDIKKDIRKTLQAENGLDDFIKRNPQILKNLIRKGDILKNALSKHMKTENDLKSLFDRTENGMKQTETKIKELIELANQMQKQCNNPSDQPKDDKDKKDGEKDKKDGEKPQNPNDAKDPKDNAKDNYDPGKSDEGGKGSRVDPLAWKDAMPKRDAEKSREADKTKRPESFSKEIEEYYRKLAQAARKIREAKEKAAREKAEKENK